DLGEVDDLVKAPVDLGPPHAEDRAAEVDVLPARQLRMEAGADLQQRTDTTSDSGSTARRFGDPRQHLEQRRLSGAVAADDADDVAVRDLERDVPERPQTSEL